MTTEAHTKIAAARLLAVSTWKYLGTPIWAMNVIECDSSRMAMPTMGVDKYWRLYYSPEYVMEHSVGKLSCVILHEVYHLIHRHIMRSEIMNARRPLDNIAMDMEVNQNVDAMVGVARSVDSNAKEGLPEGSLYPSTYNLPNGKLWEWYYRKLEEDYPESEDAEGKGEGESGDGVGGAGYGGSCADGEKRPWEYGEPANGAKKDKDEGGGSGEEVPDGVKAGRAETLMRQMAQDIKAAQERGDVPSNLAAWAGEVLEPKVDWRRELRATVRRAVNFTAGFGDFTYRRLSRRQGNSQFIRPGTHAPCPSIAIGWDTSGSMHHLMAAAAGEIQGIASQAGVGDLWVIPCDAEAGTPIKIKPRQRIEGISDDITGGGGTDMGKCVTAAAKMKCDIIIIITDCITPWGCDEPPANVIIAAVGATEDTLKQWPAPDWAKVIIVEDDE